MAIIKNLQTLNAGEGVEKREPSCIVGGNVNWYNHYGEQNGDFLKEKQKQQLGMKLETTQQSHYWAYTWENCNWKRHMHPNVHCSTIYSS